MNAGNSWMGKYSRWTFQEDKSYVMVAKEMQVPGSGQKVPLLDAELNENAEIFINSLRRMIQRTYGNGTKNNGFKIMESGTGTVNNFKITGGDGTQDNAGYIFMSGWMPVIPSNVEYFNQSGVVALTTPTSNRTDQVYLDVYLSEVGPATDPEMVDSNIGFETSRRIKLNWLVRVAEGGSTPADYIDADNIKHWTYHIATINRLANNSNILQSMIVDTRNTIAVHNYLHVENPASALWHVTHGLNSSYCMVQVFKTDGTKIMPGKVQILTANTLDIDLDGISVAGYAIIMSI